MAYDQRTADLEKENAAMKKTLSLLCSRYHRGSFINCVTPSARQDAKRGSESAKIFKLWDDALNQSHGAFQH